MDGWMDTNTTAYIVHTYIIEAICVSVTPTQKLNQHIYAAELKQKANDSSQHQQGINV